MGLFEDDRILIKTYIHTRLTALFLGRPRWAGTRKEKPIWILLKQETVSGSGISWAVCKSAPHSRQITMPAPHRSVFTGWVPFLPPNQQRQSTEGTKNIHTYEFKCFGARKLMKEFPTSGGRRSLWINSWNIWKNNWSNVWLISGLVHSRLLLMRQWMNGVGDLGLCLYKGAALWTFIVMSDVASHLLTCSC